MPVDVEGAQVHVLLLGDGASWCEEVASWCRAAGYSVSSAAARGAPHDIAIVDLDRMPLDALRTNLPTGAAGPVPVLATTAQRQAEDLVVEAYAAGADQVVQGPLREHELIARIRLLLRHSRPPVDAALAALAARQPDDPITFDPATRTATVASTAVPLTAREAEVLRALLARPGRVVTRSELAARDPEGGVLGAVDGLVRCLRAKLEAVEGRRRIVAVRGVGFRLLPDAVALAPEAEPAPP